MKTDKNIKEENSGFKVPKDYFNSLETSILMKAKTEEMSEKSGFSIPKDYFSNLDVKLSKEDNSSKVISLKNWDKWIAAASIVAAAVLGAFYIDRISVEQNIQFSDLDNNDIERYLEYNLETPEEFIDYENTSIKDNLESNISKLDDEDIFEYLDDKLEEQDYDNEN